MKHAKKLIALVLCLVLTLGLGLGVCADFGEIVYPKPRWSYVSYVSGGVNTSEMSGSIALTEATKYATINITLQKYNGGWKDTNITISDAGYRLASTSTPVSLSAGLYRAKIVFRVYTSQGGAYVEGDTVYSTECLL